MSKDNDIFTKTEFILMLIGARHQLRKIIELCNIYVGEYDTYPSSCVRNLGARFNNK